MNTKIQSCLDPAPRMSLKTLFITWKCQAASLLLLENGSKWPGKVASWGLFSLLSLGSFLEKGAKSEPKRGYPSSIQLVVHLTEHVINCKQIIAHRDRETIYIKEEAGTNSFRSGILPFHDTISYWISVSVSRHEIPFKGRAFRTQSYNICPSRQLYLNSYFSTHKLLPWDFPVWTKMREI